MAVLTVAEQVWPCLQTVQLKVRLQCGRRALVEAFVVAKQPFGYSCIVGLDAMDQLEGATIHANRLVTFGT